MSVSVIAKSVQEQHLRTLAGSIIGTAEPEEILALIEEVVPDELGFQSVFLSEFSAGAVFGLHTEQGKLLLKFHAPNCDLAAIQSRSNFQAWLAAQGYPAPGIVHPPSEQGQRHYTIEAYLDDGRRADGHAPDDIGLMAEYLATLVTLGESYADATSIPCDVLEPSDYYPWPVPHNSLFDFEATRAGAAWIDATGRDAFQVLETSQQPLLIGHMDWGAKHCRIVDDYISAVYDWDSIGRFTENRILGAALVNFAASWYVEGPNEPTLAEMEVFLKRYLSHRQSAFDAREIIAAVRYGTAYGARCEHSVQAEKTAIRDLLKLVCSDGFSQMITRNLG